MYYHVFLLFSSSPQCLAFSTPGSPKGHRSGRPACDTLPLPGNLMAAGGSNALASCLGKCETWMICWYDLCGSSCFNLKWDINLGCLSSKCSSNLAQQELPCNPPASSARVSLQWMVWVNCHGGGTQAPIDKESLAIP